MGVPASAEYVVRRLSELGIDRVFGIPGGYAFPIDGEVESCQALKWIGCANELNAADGYARRNAAAILSTTCGVGECCQTNANSFQLPLYKGPLIRAEAPPFGESSGAVGRHDVPAGEAAS
jgi:Thiamine pyrophosphate enzyme, N-terminal TPP binding domain